MNISFWFSLNGLRIEVHGPEGKEVFLLPYTLLNIFKSTHDITGTPLFNENVLRMLSEESHNFNFHKNPPSEQVEPGNIPTGAWEDK